MTAPQDFEVPADEGYLTVPGHFWRHLVRDYARPWEVNDENLVFYALLCDGTVGETKEDYFFPYTGLFRLCPACRMVFHEWDQSGDEEQRDDCG